MIINYPKSPFSKAALYAIAGLKTAPHEISLSPRHKYGLKRKDKNTIK